MIVPRRGSVHISVNHSICADPHALTDMNKLVLVRMFSERHQAFILNHSEASTVVSSRQRCILNVISYREMCLLHNFSDDSRVVIFSEFLKKLLDLAMYKSTSSEPHLVIEVIHHARACSSHPQLFPPGVLDQILAGLCRREYKTIGEGIRAIRWPASGEGTSRLHDMVNAHCPRNKLAINNYRDVRVHVSRGGPG